MNNDPGGKSSLEAAAEAAAKVNAMLIARGKLKPSQLSGTPTTTIITNKPRQPQIGQSNLVVAEVEINDAPIGCRNMLTRGTTQEDISKMSGAAVSTRGRYMNPDIKAKNIGSGERPLYLFVQGPDQRSVDIAVSRIRDIIDSHQKKRKDYSGNRFLAQLDSMVGMVGQQTTPTSLVSNTCSFVVTTSHPPPPLMSLTTQPPGLTFIQDKIYTGLENAPPGFDLKSRILGPGGSYLQHIQAETGAKVQFRGKGSGCIDPISGREDLEPLHIHLQHTTLLGVQQAKELADNLIQTVQQEYAQYQQALAMMPPAPGQPAMVATVQMQTPGCTILTPQTSIAQPIVGVHQIGSTVLTNTSYVPASVAATNPQFMTTQALPGGQPVVIGQPLPVQHQIQIAQANNQVTTQGIPAGAVIQPSQAQISASQQVQIVQGPQSQMPPVTSLPPPGVAFIQTQQQQPPPGPDVWDGLRNQLAQAGLQVQINASNGQGPPQQQPQLLPPPQEPQQQQQQIQEQQYITVVSQPGEMPLIQSSVSGPIYHHTPHGSQTFVISNNLPVTSTAAAYDYYSKVTPMVKEEHHKRRFTEEKEDDKVPENLLGYQHGPPHLATVVNPSANTSTCVVTSSHLESLYTQSNIGNGENRHLGPPPDKKLMPPPVLVGNKRMHPHNQDPRDVKRVKGALGSVASVYGSDEEEEDLTGLRKHKNEAKKYAFNQYSAKPQIYPEQLPDYPPPPIPPGQFHPSHEDVQSTMIRPGLTLQYQHTSNPIQLMTDQPPPPPPQLVGQPQYNIQPGQPQFNPPQALQPAAQPTFIPPQMANIQEPPPGMQYWAN